jgi:proteasome lid subunit RPN8/RPN11
VQIAKVALEKIQRTVGCGWDGREIGGGLYGTVRGGRIVIEDVIGPGVTAKRSPRRFELNIDYCRAIRDQMPQSWRLLGDWHTHPGSTPASEQDRRAWLSLGRKQLGPWVGLVVPTDQSSRTSYGRVKSFDAYVAENGHVRSVNLELPERNL